MLPFPFGMDHVRTFYQKNPRDEIFSNPCHPAEYQLTSQEICFTNMDFALTPPGSKVTSLFYATKTQECTKLTLRKPKFTPNLLNGLLPKKGKGRRVEEERQPEPRTEQKIR